MKNNKKIGDIVPFYHPGFYLTWHYQHFDLSELHRKYNTKHKADLITAMDNDAKWDQQLLHHMLHETTVKDSDWSHKGTIVPDNNKLSAEVKQSQSMTPTSSDIDISHLKWERTGKHSIRITTPIEPNTNTHILAMATAHAAQNQALLCQGSIKIHINNEEAIIVKRKGHKFDMSPRKQHNDLKGKLRQECECNVELELLDITPNLSFYVLHDYFSKCQDEKALDFLQNYCDTRTRIDQHKKLHELSHADLHQHLIGHTLHSISENIDTIIEGHPKLWPYILMQILGMEHTLPKTSFRLRYTIDDQFCPADLLRQLRFIPWITKADNGSILALARFMVDGSFLEHEKIIDAIMNGCSSQDIKNNWCQRLQYATRIRTEIQRLIMTKLKIADKQSIQEAHKAELEHLNDFYEKQKTTSSTISSLLLGLRTTFTELDDAIKEPAALKAITPASDTRHPALSSQDINDRKDDKLSEVEKALLQHKETFSKLTIPNPSLQTSTYRVYMRLQKVFSKIFQGCLNKAPNLKLLSKERDGLIAFSKDRTLQNKFFVSLHEEDKAAAIDTVTSLHHFCMMQSNQKGSERFHDHRHWLIEHLKSHQTYAFFEAKAPQWRQELDAMKKICKHADIHHWLLFLRTLQITPAFVFQQVLNSNNINVPDELTTILNNMPGSLYYYDSPFFENWQQQAKENEKAILMDYLRTHDLLSEYANLPESIKPLIIGQYNAAYHYFLSEMITELEYHPEHFQETSYNSVDLKALIQAINNANIAYNRTQHETTLDSQTALEMMYNNADHPNPFLRASLTRTFESQANDLPTPADFHPDIELPLLNWYSATEILQYLLSCLLVPNFFNNQGHECHIEMWRRQVMLDNLQLKHEEMLRSRCKEQQITPANIDTILEQAMHNQQISNRCNPY